MIDHNFCLLFYLIMIHYFLNIVFQRPIEMEVNIIFTPEVKYSRQVVWLAKHFDSIQSVVKLNWSSVTAVVSFVLPPVSKVVKGYVSYVYERPLAPVENWRIGETWGYVFFLAKIPNSVVPTLLQTQEESHTGELEAAWRDLALQLGLLLRLII